MGSGKVVCESRFGTVVLQYLSSRQSSRTEIAVGHDGEGYGSEVWVEERS